MEQSSSTYQSLKILIAEYVPIDRDILHVLIGLALTVVAVVIARKSMRLRPFLGAFVIACLLGATMEVLDLRDDLKTLGAWRWRASGLDFIRTIFVPTIGVFIAYMLQKRRR